MRSISALAGKARMRRRYHAEQDGPTAYHASKILDAKGFGNGRTMPHAPMSLQLAASAKEKSN
jgi:hypothetical protein